MLLTNNADINMKNNEGLKPKDLATDQNVKKLMLGSNFTSFFSLTVVVILFFLKTFVKRVTNFQIINKSFKNRSCWFFLPK